MNKYKFKGEKPLQTKKTGLVIARDFTRIVHGGRGAYVEIADKDINKAAMTLIKARHTYYDEYRAGDELVKFYLQRRTVKYADYKVGMWYVSPVDLQGFEVVGRYEVKR